jgi:LysM repeat protein
VQPGESWNSIAQKFGVSAEALQAANPQAVRPGLVLYRDDQLTIPGQAGSAPETTAAATPEATATLEATATAATTATPADADATASPEASPAPDEEAALVCPTPFAIYPARLADLAGAGESMESILDLLRL